MTYESRITKATGISDPKAVAEIQYEMRSGLSGLDHLSNAAFNRLARESAQTCVALGAIAMANYVAALVR